MQLLPPVALMEGDEGRGEGDAWGWRPLREGRELEGWRGESHAATASSRLDGHYERRGGMEVERGVYGASSSAVSAES